MSKILDLFVDNPQVDFFDKKDEKFL